MTQKLRQTLKACALLLVFALFTAAGLTYHWARLALDREAEASLSQKWSAMKGYLRISSDANHAARDEWYYDSDDPDEASLVRDLQARCFIADQNGSVLRASPMYREAGMESNSEVRQRIGRMVRSENASRALWTIRWSAQGQRYRVRAGVVFDERGRSPYYVALAVPLAGGRQVLFPFACMLLAAIVSALLLGWVLALIAYAPLSG
ncbi:MAG TPA: hypothetical protein VKU19_26245 [Bryobacteraceae bacterium]|nr:hypothetical protein [Bryobacteraceae bacterium]